MRIFRIDVGTCAKCGGEMKLVAAVKDRGSIRRYLKGAGLPEDPPPIAKARQRHLDWGERAQAPPAPDRWVDDVPVYI
jgi:hypothetical protein